MSASLPNPRQNIEKPASLLLVLVLYKIDSAFVTPTVGRPSVRTMRIFAFTSPEFKLGVICKLPWKGRTIKLNFNE